MIKKLFFTTGVFLASGIIFFIIPFFASAAYDGNSSGYAWGERVGWISFNTTSSYGAQNTRTYLDGYIWGEDIGYISLKRDSGSPDYGIIASQSGANIRLSGSVWGPQSGWIKFAADGSDYGNNAANNYGVTIDITTGEYSGYAWGEDTGWINFSGACAFGTTGACTGGTYEVTTSFFPFADGESCNNGDECANALCVSGTCRAAGSCSNASYVGAGCSGDGINWNNATGGGTCLTAGTCDQTDPVAMDCGAVCAVGDATYDTCLGRGGDACDSETGGGDFAQAGMCYADASSNGCLTSGFIYYDDTYYASSTNITTAAYDWDSDNNGESCDSAITSGGDYSVSGMVALSGGNAACVLTTGVADTVYVAASNNNYFTSGCGVSAEKCDYDTTADLNNPFTADGACITGNTCDTDEVCFDDINYQNDCSSCSFAATDIDTCMADVGGAGYTADGYCSTGGVCSTGTVYNNGGTLTDGCTNGGGESCDSDATGGESGAFSTAANGICVSGSTCDTVTMSCRDTGDGLYKNTCSDCGVAASEANRCDTDITNGSYTANGVCTDADTCTTGALYNDESVLKAGCSAGAASDVDPCEADASDGYSANGMCVSGSTCQTAGVYLNGTTITSGCTNGGGEACYTDAQNDGSLTSWSPTGVCTSGSVCTASTLVALDGGTYYATCSGHTGKACDADGGGSFSQTGVCLSDGTCDAVDVSLSAGSYYLNCDGYGGKQCEADTSSGDFSQSGMCFDNGGAVDGTNFDCQTAGHICFDGTNYQTSCASCSTGNGCDSAITTGGDYGANGICLSNSSCDDSGSAAKDCSYAEADCAVYYSSCASVNNNDRCDTDVTDGSFANTGICAAGVCTALTAETGNCADTLDNDGDGGVDLYDTDCNNIPSIPVLVSPSDGTALSDNTPTLSASYTDSLQAGYTYYRIVSTSQSDCVNGSNLLINGISTKTIAQSGATIYTPPISLANSGTYYWCAQNFDGYLSSAWTAMGSFTLTYTSESDKNLNVEMGDGETYYNGLEIQ